MKKKIVVYVLMAFIALFLIFRFVSISNNINLQRGIVRSVSATEHNDIVIELENDSFYYKNRHKAQRKAKFYINKCRSASCMQSGWKRTPA